MPWVRIDENFPEHPKVVAAGEDAAWLFVCALGYCNRHLTDGVVPAGALRLLTGHKTPQRLAARLVDVGLFEPHEEGYLVHDFLDYQPSKASIEEERSKARQRMARNRQSSPEHSPEPNGDVRPNNGRGSSYPTRPDPTRSNHISDDDDSADTPDPTSSSVDQIISTTALAIALKDRERPARAFVNGIAKNLRRERLDEVNDCVTQGLSTHDAAIRLDADPWFVAKALNGSTP